MITLFKNRDKEVTNYLIRSYGIKGRSRQKDRHCLLSPMAYDFPIKFWSNEQLSQNEVNMESG